MYKSNKNIKLKFWLLDCNKYINMEIKRDINKEGIKERLGGGIHKN
jgi:hypothetical protein